MYAKKMRDRFQCSTFSFFSSSVAPSGFGIVDETTVCASRSSRSFAEETSSEFGRSVETSGVGGPVRLTFDASVYSLIINAKKNTTPLNMRRQDKSERFVVDLHKRKPIPISGVHTIHIVLTLFVNACKICLRKSSGL